MDQQRPFRFGVASESAPSREQWTALVRKVEDLGYATFLLAVLYLLQASIVRLLVLPEWLHI